MGAWVPTSVPVRSGCAALQQWTSDTHTLEACCMLARCVSKDTPPTHTHSCCCIVPTLLLCQHTEALRVTLVNQTAGDCLQVHLQTLLTDEAVITGPEAPIASGRSDALLTEQAEGSPPGGRGFCSFTSQHSARLRLALCGNLL